jgi:hypothetical protein
MGARQYASLRCWKVTLRWLSKIERWQLPAAWRLNSSQLYTVAAAAAVASLPERVREAYILLFDAIYGQGSFDKEEEHAWDF